MIRLICWTCREFCPIDEAPPSIPPGYYTEAQVRKVIDWLINKHPNRAIFTLIKGDSREPGVDAKHDVSIVGDVTIIGKDNNAN